MLCRRLCPPSPSNRHFLEDSNTNVRRVYNDGFRYRVQVAQVLRDVDDAATVTGGGSH